MFVTEDDLGEGISGQIAAAYASSRHSSIVSGAITSTGNMGNRRGYMFRIERKVATPSFGELLLARRHAPDEGELPDPPLALSTSSFQLNEAANELVVLKRYSESAGAALFRVAMNELAVAEQLRAIGRHPNVIRFFDAALAHRSDVLGSEQQVQLVMEFCERGDVFAMLSRQPDTRVDEARALDIVAQVASGLSFLHSHGISHGNLSLENILIDSTGRCKLADFRLSHVNIDIAPPLHPIGDMLLASLDYMAPERMSRSSTQGALYDPIAEDIWALGVVLFMLITGVPLVDRSSGRLYAVEALRSLDCAGALQLWQLDHLLSDDATFLLGKLIAIDPAKRFQSVEEALRLPVLANRLGRVQAGEMHVL